MICLIAFVVALNQFRPLLGEHADFAGPALDANEFRLAHPPACFICSRAT